MYGFWLYDHVGRHHGQRVGLVFRRALEQEPRVYCCKFEGRLLKQSGSVFIRLFIHLESTIYFI